MVKMGKEGSYHSLNEKNKSGHDTMQSIFNYGNRLKIYFEGQNNKIGN